MMIPLRKGLSYRIWWISKNEFHVFVYKNDALAMLPGTEVLLHPQRVQQVNIILLTYFFEYLGRNLRIGLPIDGDGRF